MIGDAGAVRQTDANGDVTFTYTDTNGAGDDTIKASFTDATGSLQSATAQKHWVGVATAGDGRSPTASFKQRVAGSSPARPN